MSLMDKFIAWKQRREYQNNIEMSKKSSALMYLLSDTFDKSAERTTHPLHSIRLEQYKKEVSLWTKENVNINFGDSLTDMARKQISRCHDGVFSISGSWANHMEEMAIDMKNTLEKFNVVNISVGCLGGNPMLAYQNYDEVLKDSLKCLNSIRKLYPKSRIIVYGLPPVYAIYVTENSYNFDWQLYNWCLNDSDARFISLKAKFGNGYKKLFPSFKWSSDGVHFNPSGASEFEQLIRMEQK